MGQAVIVVDQYCGGGGATEGLKQAAAELGVPIDLHAINHWPVAVQTYERNHGVKPLCKSVADVHPRQAVPGGRADLLLSGFECIFFSSARGGKPVHDQGRMGAWDVPEWARELEVGHVVAENVPEFRHFGPICNLAKGHHGVHRHEDGQDTAGRCEKPVRARRGEYFQDWLREWTRLGYRWDWRILNAADHGGVTTRRRFFFQARRDGRPVRWPEPIAAAAPGRGLFANPTPRRAAVEVLDLEDLGTSIFDRARPLRPNTLLRMARGFLLFCGPFGPYFVNCLDLTPEQLAKLPRGARTGDGLEPFVFGNRTNNVPRGLGVPLPTGTTTHGGGMLLVQPFLLGQQSGSVARSASAPAPTIAGGGAIGLVQPFLSLYYGNGQPDSIDEPLSTLTGLPRHALVTPVIVPHGPRAEVRSGRDPLHTVTASDRLAAAFPTLDRFITPNFGERPGQAPRIHSLAEPVPTATSRGAGNLVTPTATAALDVDGIDPRRLVWIGPDLHLLDVYYRMLRNHELAAAMGFPRRYWFAGKPRDVTRQIGNAWEVTLATALLKTVLSDLSGPVHMEQAA